MLERKKGNLLRKSSISTIYRPVEISPGLAYIEEMKAGTNSLTLKLEESPWIPLEGHEIKYRVKGTKDCQSQVCQSQEEETNGQAGESHQAQQSARHCDLREIKWQQENNRQQEDG